jgi:hypothetical protein
MAAHPRDACPCASVQSRARADALPRFLPRGRGFFSHLRVKPHPRVNADGGGRPDGHFYPKTSIMTSLVHLLRFPELAVAAHPILLIALGYYHHRWTCSVCQNRKYCRNHQKGPQVPQNQSPRIQQFACTILLRLCL